MLAHKFGINHYDIACVIHHMLKNEFRYSAKSRCWYQRIDKGNWKQLDTPTALRNKMSNEVHTEYMRAAKRSASQHDKNDFDFASRFIEVALKLKCNGFKNTLVKECRDLFLSD